MDRMSSIELAITNEKTEMEFYLKEARRSRNPLAKAMFENLAADEHEHMLRIHGLHERLVAEGRWPADVPLEVAGTHIGETLAGVLAKADAKAEHDHDDEEAIRQAMEFESWGEQLYGDLARSSENPQEKTFFGFLSSIEREHRLSLVDTLEYLKNPQGWMELHEKIGLDGA
jgi:rubrerythrin